VKITTAGSGAEPTHPVNDQGQLNPASLTQPQGHPQPDHKLGGPRRSLTDRERGLSMDMHGVAKFAYEAGHLKLVDRDMLSVEVGVGAPNVGRRARRIPQRTTIRPALSVDEDTAPEGV